MAMYHLVNLKEDSPYEQYMFDVQYPTHSVLEAYCRIMFECPKCNIHHTGYRSHFRRRLQSARRVCVFP